MSEQVDGDQIETSMTEIGSHGGVGIAAMVSEVIDAMNSEGLYYEFNNGAGTIGATIYSNRTPIYSHAFN